MRQKKFIHNKENSIKKNTVFCAECGEALELVGIEKVDIQKIKERHKNCRKIGRFNGDKCAMLFIAEANEDLFTEDESEEKDL